MQKVFQMASSGWQFLINKHVISWSAIPVTVIIGGIFYLVKPFVDDWREKRKVKEARKIER